MVDLKAFREWAKQHPNFMTPHIISLRERDPYVIELSEGTDFSHKPIYGVTLLKMEGSIFKTTTNDGIDQMFYSKKVALEHIKAIVEPYIKKQIKN